MCAPDPPPAPDLGPTAAASAEAANLAYKTGAEDLAFRRQVYEESKPRQQQLYDLANSIAQQQIRVANANEGRAQEQWDLYQKSYRPNELQTIADAYGAQYLSDADRAQLNEAIVGGGNLTDAARMGLMQTLSTRAEDAAGDVAAARAGGEVNRAYGQQARMLGRMGAGDPQRMAIMAARLGNQQALARAGAANNAREAIRTRGAGLRSGVANFGRNMPNTAAQAFGLATNAGNAATGNANAGFMSSLPYAQFAAGGYGTQLGAAGLAGQQALGMGNLLNQQYGIAAKAAGEGDGGFGALLGLGKLGLQAYSTFGGSDRRLKENIELVGSTVYNLPLYRFSYMKVPGRVFVGVMADEVEPVVPEAVSYNREGYAMVDYGRLGITMMEVVHGA